MNQVFNSGIEPEVHTADNEQGVSEEKNKKLDQDSKEDNQIILSKAIEE